MAMEIRDAKVLKRMAAILLLLGALQLESWARRLTSIVAGTTSYIFRIRRRAD